MESFHFLWTAIHLAQSPTPPAGDDANWSITADLDLDPDRYVAKPVNCNYL